MRWGGAVEKVEGLIAKAPSIMTFLRNSSRLRTVLTLALSVISPLTLSYLSQWSDGNDERRLYAIGATTVIVVGSIGIGVLLALTSRSVADFAKDLREAEARIGAAAGELQAKEKSLEETRKELEAVRSGLAAKERYWRTLYEVQDPIRTEADWWALWFSSPREEADDDLLPEIFHSLLAPIVEQRWTLFGFEGDEDWSIAVYVRDPESDTLQCRAYRGAAESDNGETHREWPLGVGHVGVACQLNLTLYVADANADHWFELFMDRRREATEERIERDRQQFVSFAVVPFDTDFDEKPDGVVCATSSRAGRFDRENSAPLRDLAYSVGVVLRARHLPQVADAADELEIPDEDREVRGLE